MVPTRRQTLGGAAALLLPALAGCNGNDHTAAASLRIDDDIHVSGHFSQEGHYTMLDALQPRHVIPAHQDMGRLSGYVDLAGRKGYEVGRDLHVTANGNTIQLV